MVEMMTNSQITLLSTKNQNLKCIRCNIMAISVSRVLPPKLQFSHIAAKGFVWVHSSSVACSRCSNNFIL